MRTLESITEFKQEAANAVFTKQQAVAVTLQLLQKALANPNNSDYAQTIQNAIDKAEFRYIDATKTGTDQMLDSISVARFTTQNIVDGINALLFDAE